MVVAGVATGASVQVALAANGYLDQLLVEPLLLVAAACALHAAGGGPGRALGAAALVAAWLVHWQFALLFTVLLGVVVARVPAGVAPRAPTGSPADRNGVGASRDDRRGRRRRRDRRAPVRDAGYPACSHRVVARVGGPAPLGPARSLPASRSRRGRRGGRRMAGRRRTRAIPAACRLAPHPVGARPSDRRSRLRHRIGRCRCNVPCRSHWRSPFSVLSASSLRSRGRVGDSGAWPPAWLAS